MPKIQQTTVCGLLAMNPAQSTMDSARSSMEETGHNPDVLIAALVHNREKDKFLVAKRRGTLGKGESPKSTP